MGTANCTGAVRLENLSSLIPRHPSHHTDSQPGWVWSSHHTDSQPVSVFLCHRIPQTLNQSRSVFP
eukprot:1485511-Rhodomonas_salina.2